ncbi:hypothetical protein Tco_0331962 [Tanacetum coccineum]
MFHQRKLQTFLNLRVVQPGLHPALVEVETREFHQGLIQPSLDQVQQSFPLDPSPVLASDRERESHTILADVSSCGYAEGSVDASSVVEVRLWNMNWSVVILLFGVCRASRDWASCSSVTIALLLPSTTGSGRWPLQLVLEIATPQHVLELCV